MCCIVTFKLLRRTVIFPPKTKLSLGAFRFLIGLIQYMINLYKKLFSQHHPNDQNYNTWCADTDTARKTISCSLLVVLLLLVTENVHSSD